MLPSSWMISLNFAFGKNGFWSFVENQSFIHRLDKEARHVGEDKDEEDCSQHEQESLGEKL